MFYILICVLKSTRIINYSFKPTFNFPHIVVNYIFKPTLQCFFVSLSHTRQQKIWSLIKKKTSTFFFQMNYYILLSFFCFFKRV